VAKAKSQWDFGELFPPEQTRKVLTVSELTSQVRRVLEDRVGAVWVTGEVTNLRTQSSGHIYFTLKDAGAQLACVLFRNEAAPNRNFIEDGRKLLLRGEVTVYEARGQYQLLVREVELLGVGALQAAFERLKQKLQAEGLFAAERKRPLPKYPARIGLVTSPTGAAIRDVLHVVERRNPALEIVLAPCRVQGDGAAREIAAAIRLLNEYNGQDGAADRPLDLILITRGGGSIEDLWAFNEEVVARAIFESDLPVVSAVGHEIDFTISDFVADIRAATPSAAAEIITEGVFSSIAFVSEAGGRMRQLAGWRLEQLRGELGQAGARLARVHPRRRLNESLQRLDDLQSGLVRGAKQALKQRRVLQRNLVERLGRVRPAQVLKNRRDRLAQGVERLRAVASRRMLEQRHRLTTLQARLRLLGPEQVLSRGYSITTDAATGKLLRDARSVKGGQRLRTRLKAGEVFSKAEGSG
jgi:exodeoxyribonuclease VII large subunit